MQENMGGYEMQKFKEMNEKKNKPGVRYYIDTIKLEKLKNSIMARARKSKKHTWTFRLISVFLLWACAVQLFSLGKTWAPRVYERFLKTSSIPPRRLYDNNGYLMVSSNGGLNQMRSGICDMVAIARYLNVTLIVPELDKTSFWNDRSEFNDIFDVDYFIKSLDSEVRILKELPPDMKKKVDANQHLSFPPISWSNMTYYYNTVLQRIRNYTVVHLQKTDCRLANNGIPTDVQRFRCHVNYETIRFRPHIEEVGKKIINILRERGQFLVLHLRYEMDMLAFSGCYEGCNSEEEEELTAMRYAYPWWKEKVINGTEKRNSGVCPFTPEETALTLKALDIDRNIQVYIAAGDIYGGDRRLEALRKAYPNLVKKETLLPSSDLLPFLNHSSQMAALDYMVSIESDIFIPTYGGNMAKVVEGHRRFLGFKQTINLDKKELVKLIDQYRNGGLSWDRFSAQVKLVHADRMGNPIKRMVVPGKPKEEDYFYTDPEECLPGYDDEEEEEEQDDLTLTNNAPQAS